MAGPVLLADAPHLLYRAFFALPDSIKGRDGMPVNALLGSLNVLLLCIEQYKPRAVALCFGEESADYRVEAYPDYHADRPPMPDPLAAQWALSSDVYRAFGWEVRALDGLEADDLLHSLAHAEVLAGGSALILSGDRDMFQSVGDRVKMLLQRTGGKGPEEFGPDEVVERYGVPPGAVPDFIALRGDPSDGLPGAKGIGAKTAAELLRRHGSLEAAIDGAIRERPAIRRALIEQADELRMFKDIATLRTVELDPLPDTPTDFEAGAKIARELGMNRLAERLDEMLRTS